MSQTQDAPLAARDTVDVIEVLASGPAHGGGIGQFVRYLTEANATVSALNIRAVVDPRGPGHWSQTFWRLPAALAHLFYLRFTVPRRTVLHIHIAGRLSTLRKAAVILFARLLGFRCVAHYHEYGYAAFLSGLPKHVRSVVAFVLRQCQGHIVLGPNELDRLPGLIGAPPSRFTLIPNGAPRSLLDAPRAPEATPPAIVFVGALSDRKGVGDLLRATALAARSRDDWRLVLCGGGDLAARKSEAEALGIARLCEFRGQTPNHQVAEILKSARGFVLPSYAEGFAIALLEAMAAGTAVIATAVGEQAQALRDGDNAIVVTPGDAEALAAAILRLISAQEEARRLGDAARMTISGSFTIDLALQRCADALARARDA